jgi:methylenetetrahydrofolate reductase (NADPH)
VLANLADPFDPRTGHTDGVDAGPTSPHLPQPPHLPHPACPKAMVYGPCGGVGDVDDACEVDRRPCPFCHEDAPRSWVGVRRAPRRFALPTIVIDVRPDTGRPDVLAVTAARLNAGGHAALLGEHLDDPDPGHPHIAAGQITALGATVIATVTPRDRSEEECRREIADLIAAGVTAVHCVTGDHPAARFGPDMTATFSTDGTRLAALARDGGAHVTVAESPASPPTTWRAERLLSKQHAGADAAILNHAGSVDDLHRFALRCDDIGVTMALVAPVPVVTDHRSAHALTQFPGVHLPPHLLDAILHADDPRRAGIDAAVEMGRRVLEAGFDHLNLSGSASGFGTHDRIEIMTEVAGRVLAG